MAINTNITDALMFSKPEPGYMIDNICTCIIEEEESPSDENIRFRACGVASDIWGARIGIN
jgi:hypothetical protein